MSNNINGFINMSPTSATIEGIDPNTGSTIPEVFVVSPEQKEIPSATTTEIVERSLEGNKQKQKLTPQNLSVLQEGFVEDKGGIGAVMNGFAQKLIVKSGGNFGVNITQISNN